MTKVVTLFHDIATFLTAAYSQKINPHTQLLVGSGGIMLICKNGLPQIKLLKVPKRSLSLFNCIIIFFLGQVNKLFNSDNNHSAQRMHSLDFSFTPTSEEIDPGK